MKDYLEELNKNGVISFTPRGESMWPTIKNKKNSVVLLKKEGRLKVGDVGFFVRATGEYVLHRVKSVTKDGYVFQGDSQNFTETVPEESVCAYMEGFYKGKKYVDKDDEKYIKRYTKLLSNDKKRLGRVKRRNRIKGVFKKLKEIFTGKRK